ncbi:type IV pilus assembly protein FimV, partial [Massilia glaciei]|uniref:type IV pilus assembly protein FimV n=1 Tax=Massilia glaciei TaxID=1524097 RepID=UPI00351D57C1
MTVLSSLGQPLRAEIELTSVSDDESSGLMAKVAPISAFQLANIEYNPALSSLRFSIEQRNGRQFVKITSTQPVNEAFVDMLLELSWDKGRLVREYTFLLDPADLRTMQPVQVAPVPRAVVVRQPQPVPAAPAPSQVASTPAQPVQQQAPAPAPAP